MTIATHQRNANLRRYTFTVDDYCDFIVTGPCVGCGATYTVRIKATRAQAEQFVRDGAVLCRACHKKANNE